MYLTALEVVRLRVCSIVKFAHAWSAYKLCYCSVGEKEQAWQLRQLGFRLALLIVLVFSDAEPSLYEVW